MVKVRNRGKLNAGVSGKSKMFREWVMPKICEKSVDFVTGKSDDLQGLQDTKNQAKELKNNPFNMIMVKNYANAKVRHWLITMVNNDMQIKMPSGEMKKAHIDALDIDGNVAFVCFEYIGDYISTIKDKPLKEKLNAELKNTINIPRRESYY